MNDNIKLFDEWASTYDNSVIESDQNNTYPFAGYRKIQELIYEMIIKKRNTKILEMGIGTGKMTFSLYKEGYDITGVDSSNKMIEKAKELMPQSKFINKKFGDSLPDLGDTKFDVIIFTYSIHHIKTINQKNLLNRLSKNLNCNGIIIIGDVITRTNNEMKTLEDDNIDIWDDEEYYPTLENYSNQMIKQHYKLDYIKVTFCSGILILDMKKDTHIL